MCFFEFDLIEIVHFQVLFRWKGSVYKLIFKELFVYLAVYFIINVFYRTVLMDDKYDDYRKSFESLKGL